MANRIIYWTQNNRWPLNLKNNQIQRLKIKYDSEYCQHCMITNDELVIANTDHIYTTCEIAKKQNEKLQMNIFKKFYDVTKIKFQKTDIPWWFTTDTVGLERRSADEKALENFIKEDGDQGYIPTI
jgi:hypothetical protein